MVGATGSWERSEYVCVLGLDGGEPKRRRRQVRRRWGLGLDGNDGYDELMDREEGGGSVEELTAGSLVISESSGTAW